MRLIWLKEMKDYSSKFKMKCFLKYLIFSFYSFQIIAQSDSTKGVFSGSLQIEAQRYLNDNSFIYKGLEKKYGINNYLNLNYQKGKFRAGIRLESYTPPLLYYPQNLDGFGLTNRFINYKTKKIEATIGHFYEQFGNGMMLRSQEQRFLGMDTSIDGLNFKANPTKNYQIKTLVGKQRLAFTHAEGWLWGIDNQLNISDLTQSKNDNLKIGLSYLQKYEPYDGILKSIKPNVYTVGGRLNYQLNLFSFNFEYVSKSQDASPINKYVVNKGSAAYISSNFDLEKLSLSIQLKRIDNMDFRSQRTESLNNALINFIPATTKQHTARLLTLYPYSSQVLGEIGGQIDMIYSIDENSSLSVNFSKLNGLKKEYLDKTSYKSEFLGFGEQYYQDFNIEFEKNWNKKIKTNLLFAAINFNKGQILGGKPELVKSYTFGLDATYKFVKRKSIKLDLQHLTTKQDFRNWAYGLIEFGMKSKYFFFISDEWNYSNQKHFANIGTAFSYKKGRISLSYGNQREGLLCVGGICRITPAYRGFSLGIVGGF
jgi:hypothetical protein